jgi:DNA-binding winged helix-turn-helix (wHTH) protein/tetratricopeptide (TPR) repeat protein
MTIPRSHIYEFDQFRLDAGERVLYANGKPLALSPRLFDTLLALVEMSGRVMEKEELMAKVWADSFVEENNLNKNISALRKLLGDGSEGLRYIETVPRRGYRFIAEVREVPGGESEWMIARRTRSSVVIEEEIESEPKTQIIAVLPFKTFGVNGSSEYLGLGLADALITRLSAAPQLIVRPTSSIVKYHHTDQDSFIIGRELRVDAVLEGSIRRLESRLRVTVQLVSVKEETALWAEKFDEAFTDIFAVEDAISERVAERLMLRLTSQERRLLTKRHTDNLEAHVSYFKGIYYYSKQTPEGLEKAMQAFTEASLRDPNYALAYTALSGCSSMIYFRNVSAPPAKEAALKAKLYAEKALTLDDALAEAHVVYLIATLYYDYDFSWVERNFDRVLAMNPKSSPSHRWCGIYLAAKGRFAEALQVMRQACDADPLSSIGNSGMAFVYYYMREYDQAIAAFEKTLQFEPNYSEARLGLATVYALQGRYTEAFAELDQPFFMDLTRKLAVKGFIYARSGDRTATRRMLEELCDFAVHAYVNPREMAILHAALGEVDEAFTWIEKAYAEHHPWLIYINVDVWTAPLRSDPRFTDLLRRIGLEH